MNERALITEMHRIARAEFHRVNAEIEHLQRLFQGIQFPGVGIHPFQVQSVADDWLVCKKMTSAGAGTTTLKVAKPPLLQRTPYDDETIDGVTYTYTDGDSRNADDGTFEEDQEIIISYTEAVDGLIFAAGPMNTLIVDDSDKPIVWMDLNVDGRHWARKKPS